MTLPSLSLELYELEEAAPTILSLAIMELLLSIDRLQELSERAAFLPDPQRRTALRLGGALADVARLTGLLIAAPLISKFLAAKLLGALYLLERMTSHFSGMPTGRERPDLQNWGLARSVFAVALLDLSYSIGNLVAALSLTRTVWVVASSLIFWMALTRLLARPIIRLKDRAPFLRHTVPLLSGGIGCLLLIEMVSHSLHLHPTTPWQKFWGLVAIVGAASLYHLAPATLRRLADAPLQRVGVPLLGILNRPLAALFSPLRALLGLGGLSARH
jgi:predicted tellurium resistance membrane protein TerC